MIKWNYWKWYDVVMSCLGCLGTKCLTIILWNNKSTVKPRLIFIWDQFYPPMYAECQILGQLWWLITLYIFCHFRWERKKIFFTKSALKWILESAKVFFSSSHGGGGVKGHPWRDAILLVIGFSLVGFDLRLGLVNYT